MVQTTFQQFASEDLKMMKIFLKKGIRKAESYYPWTTTDLQSNREFARKAASQNGGDLERMDECSNDKIFLIKSSIMMNLH